MAIKKQRNEKGTDVLNEQCTYNNAESSVDNTEHCIVVKCGDVSECLTTAVQCSYTVKFSRIKQERTSTIHLNTFSNKVTVSKLNELHLL